MDTKSVEKKVWLYIAAASLFISVASLFTTIFVYNNKAWTYKFNILGLIRGKDFVNNVLASYTGKVYWKIDATWVTLLAIISVASLVCAVVGLVTLRQQRTNRMQFWLTIIGLIGTCLPALLVLVAVPVFQKGFPGKLRYGIYPIVAPIATLISVLAVYIYRKKNKVQEELRKELEDKGKIWKANADDLY